MTVGEKIRYLRQVEGSLRGLDRALTQPEAVAAVKRELGASISQSYWSQIESGARPHMTRTTRMLLARFFKVHPGFLVDDPEGFHMDLTSDLRTTEGKLDVWLLQGAELFRRDPEVSQSLLAIASLPDSRQAMLLVSAILETPGLAERLMEALKGNPAPRRSKVARKTSKHGR